jgi:hypothetical protein
VHDLEEKREVSSLYHEAPCLGFYHLTVIAGIFPNGTSRAAVSTVIRTTQTSVLYVSCLGSLGIDGIGVDIVMLRTRIGQQPDQAIFQMLPTNAMLSRTSVPT